MRRDKEKDGACPARRAASGWEANVEMAPRWSPVPDQKKVARERGVRRGRRAEHGPPVHCQLRLARHDGSQERGFFFH